MKGKQRIPIEIVVNATHTLVLASDYTIWAACVDPNSGAIFKWEKVPDLPQPDPNYFDPEAF